MRARARVAASAGGALALAVVLAVLIGGGATAATSPEHAAVFVLGDLGGRPWRVAVGSQGRHRKGVCLQTLVTTGEDLFCAGPVRRRGIVTVTGDGRAPHGRARMTVIAAALNRTVRALRLVRDDGTVIRMHPRPIGVRRADAHIKNFRYLAKAVRGSICAERLETVGAEGNVLWDVPESELERMGLLCEYVPGAGLVPRR